ncbi:MAG: hypothetical protein Q8P81_04050 [Nanoarchaeota archaeon]|nr:hypothetical protein [Nanoarchaeota archaeon]
MGVLEQVAELKNNGLEEAEIINKLKESGVSPKEISDALNQVRIKKAVSSEDTGESTKEMEPSIMANPEEVGESLPTEGDISDEDLNPPQHETNQKDIPRRGFSPMTKEILQENVPVPSEKRQENEPQYEEYAPHDTHTWAESGADDQTGAESRSQRHEYQNYSEQEDYPQEDQQDYGYALPQTLGSPRTSDTDMIIEISEQVFLEKIKDLQKKIDDLTEFKTLSEVKIDNMSDRLKRIELHIDRLQTDILEKVGSYGRGVDSIKKEMGMMQDSFGKIVNNLADTTEEKNSHKTHQTPHHSPSHTSHQAHKSHPTHAKTKKK